MFPYTFIIFGIVIILLSFKASIWCGIKMADQSTAGEAYKMVILGSKKITREKYLEIKAVVNRFIFTVVIPVFLTIAIVIDRDKDYKETSFFWLIVLLLAWEFVTVLIIGHYTEKIDWLSDC